MNLRKLMCKTDSTIKEVMECINANGKGTAFIVDEKETMVGIITDGDIRRLLISGYGLNEKIDSHINTNYVYALTNENSQSILDKFTDTIKIIPILNEEKHLVDFMEYDKKMRVSLAQPQLNGNEYKYLMDAFLSTWISSTGKYVNKFEDDFSDYCGVKYGVATSNGTTALHLALLALGISEGDEVIVPDLTFAATINAVIYTGATPVIVDIEPDGWCIDPVEIEKAITKKTKAIIPVHIYGQPCDMDKICAIARKYNLFVIEDCAEAHGAEYNGKRVGSFGDISCFSFFGNKVVTTGEGGMCITNSAELNKKMRVFRDHGMSPERRYYHEVIGYNYRMTNLQAAIGVAQVERIDEILKWRDELEQQYRETFQQVSGIELQRNDLPKRNKIAWLVSILVDEDKRDAITERMKEENIDIRNFFIPLSEMPIYQKYARECVQSKQISRRGLNLPTNADITAKEIIRIKEIIQSV